MATEGRPPAGRFYAMADALDAAADVFETADDVSVRLSTLNTLRRVREQHMPLAVRDAREWAIWGVLVVGEEGLACNPWMLRALALGLRRDAARMDGGGHG